MSPLEYAPEQRDLATPHLNDLIDGTGFGQKVLLPRDTPRISVEVEAWSGPWLFFHVILKTACDGGFVGGGDRGDIVGESVDDPTTFLPTTSAESGVDSS